jgi:hypothetical protein
VLKKGGAMTTVARAAALLFALSPTLAGATVYNIHVGGACSTLYTNGKGAASGVGNWAGETSINASVDQRSSMSTAVANLKAIFDTNCKGSNSCWVFAYSNGAAVTSKVLSLYTGYNVDYAMITGGNEGGSELTGTGWVGEAFGVCSLASGSQISPSSHRNGWNHNATDGTQFWHLAGNGTIWWTLGTTSLLIPGNDDSVVGLHSAAGYNTAGSFSNTCGGGKYSSHYVESGLCGGGTSNHHLNISRAYVCRLGGC